MNGAVDYSRQHSLNWSFQFLSPSLDSRWKILKGSSVDGIILHATKAEMVERAEELAIPWVNVSSKLDPLPRVSVVMDNRAVGALAAETLAEAENVRPALVTMENLHFAKERAEGFLERLPEPENVPVFSLPALGLYREPNVEWEAEEEEMVRFLRKLATPAFVFCVNDEVALLVRNLAQRIGFTIPQDLCLLGVDNRAVQLGAPLNRISSIEVSTYALSFLAARLINEHGCDQGNLRDQIVRLPPVGVVHRQSTWHRKTEDPILERVFEFVGSLSPWEEMNVAKLAETVGCSRRYLEKQFMAEFNLTPKAFLERSLLVRARHLLANSQLSLSDVVGQTGFSDLRQMNAAFRRHHGTTAKGYRERFL